MIVTDRQLLLFARCISLIYILCFKYLSLAKPYGHGRESLELGARVSEGRNTGRHEELLANRTKDDEVFPKLWRTRLKQPFGSVTSLNGSSFLITFSDSFGKIRVVNSDVENGRWTASSSDSHSVLGPKTVPIDSYRVSAGSPSEQRITGGAASPMEGFSEAKVVYPQVVHARTKRALRTTLDETGHANHISLGLTIGDKNVVFDLLLNRDLLGVNYFEKYLHSNGSHSLKRGSEGDVALCHYQGSIRDRPGSWAAVSTCQGVRGVVFDGEETYYLEPAQGVRTPTVTTPHYLLNHRHLVDNNLSCGYHGSSQPFSELFDQEEFRRLLRYKRQVSDSGTIRGPFNANSLSRYVELVLVADKTEYEKHNSDVEKIQQRFKDITNIVNALYQPLNIFIALVGVEIWQEEDPVEISTDGDKTLTNFLNYRKVRLIPEHPNDNAQLLTGKVFDSGVVGKALKGPICTYQYSGGVNMDHSESVGLVATTVAHEMGHNFGMEHDKEEDCKCPDKRCIMAPSSGTRSPSHWSSCSHEYLAISFERSMDYCLRNKPTSLFSSPVCGNGFVEPGEQCDCGLVEYCTNQCCNASSCMLFHNATCATGHCCDLQTCQPKPSGVECREMLHECDLSEYCSGDSEYCPDNFYKEDGHSCLAGNAYCYQGMCRTHEHQCRLLWGPTGKNSHDKCYNLNREGNPNGNCGYNWANKTYKKCETDDVKCGMMHCKHFNERLEFGMESVSKVSHRFIADINQGVIPCRVAQVDLGLDMVDPGLAPDGAKCGYKKMCVGQRCMEVASLRKHDCDCNGQGVCNNMGHCHCDIGFTWPECKYPGLGGSMDSGPASNPHGSRLYVTGLFIFFFGVLPLFVLVFCLVYVRGNFKLWWMTKGIPASCRFPGFGVRRKTASPRPVCIEVMNKVQGQTSTPVRPPSPHSSQGSKCNSPLLNGHANSNIQSSLVGKYEGFTLSPIKHKVPVSVNGGAVTSKSNDEVDSAVSTSKWKVKPSHLPHNVWPPPKLDISNPSLQTSTNPAVVSGVQLELRSAPSPPTTPFPTGAVISPSRHAPDRPKSVPDASALVGEGNHGKTSTVARIASFLSKKEKEDIVSPLESHPEGMEIGTLPRKAAKINRESLLQLEISNPIQVQATDLPLNLIPVRTAPEPPSDNKGAKTLSGKVTWAPSVGGHIALQGAETSDLVRVASMRESSIRPRPPIPKFGSMRAVRPKSLPPIRPSQPPPRPPLPMIPGSPETEYVYDDCLNFKSVGAPLAPGESDSSPQEGIYATIDEDSPTKGSPSEKKAKRSIFSLVYAKMKKKSNDQENTEPVYCNIDSVDGEVKEESPPPLLTAEISSSSTTIEDGGLLSEIVSELVNREPQYVNTLGKDKKWGSSDNSSFPIKQESHPKGEKTNSSSTDVVKPLSTSYVTYSNIKPRGVFSFFKASSIDKSGAEESGLVKLSPGNTEEPKSNVLRSSLPPSSLAVTLAGVKAASQEVGKRVNATESNVREKAQPKMGINSEVTTKASSKYEATTGNSRPKFPPDKILSYSQKSSLATSRPAFGKVPEAKTSLVQDIKRSSVTSPTSGKSKVVSPQKSVTPEGVKTLTSPTSEKVQSVSGVKPTISVKVKSAILPKDSLSSSGKEVPKYAGVKKASRLPSATMKTTVASASRSAILSAAAKPGCQSKSRVASIQQKFENINQESKVKPTSTASTQPSS